MKVRKLKLHETKSHTWRVLVEGIVHPLLVGFDSTDDAIAAAVKFFASDELVFEQDNADPMRYIPLYAVVGNNVDAIQTFRRFLPSELEMEEIDNLLIKHQLTPHQATEQLSGGLHIGDGLKKEDYRYYLVYNGTRFGFNSYDLESLPPRTREWLTGPEEA